MRFLRIQVSVAGKGSTVELATSIKNFAHGSNMKVGARLISRYSPEAVLLATLQARLTMLYRGRT